MDARTRIPDLSAIDLRDEGKRLYHVWLYYKPFKSLLQVVFVLNADINSEKARQVILFATDPEMAPEQVYRIHVHRFRIEFNSPGCCCGAVRTRARRPRSRWLASKRNGTVGKTRRGRARNRGGNPVQMWNGDT